VWRRFPRAGQRRRQWWEDVCSGDVTYKSTKGAKKEFTVSAALVAKVLGSGEGDEVSQVRMVMCSLLAH
jgi:hypothetical protein